MVFIFLWWVFFISNCLVYWTSALQNSPTNFGPSVTSRNLFPNLPIRATGVMFWPKRKWWLRLEKHKVTAIFGISSKNPTVDILLEYFLNKIRLSSPLCCRSIVAKITNWTYEHVWSEPRGQAFSGHFLKLFTTIHL